VFVTDCRVAVACGNYLKVRKLHPCTPAPLHPCTPAPLHPGRTASHPAVNTVNKAKVNQRQAGNLLVGHVRYPWLSLVGFKELTGWRSRLNRVRLTIANPQREGIAPTLLLDIGMPGLSTGAMAHDIVRRAAYYRLHQPDSRLSDQARRRLEELLSDPPLAAKPEGFTMYNFNSPPCPTEP
jgi:hypothetical protein